MNRSCQPACLGLTFWPTWPYRHLSYLHEECVLTISIASNRDQAIFDDRFVAADSKQPKLPGNASGTVSAALRGHVRAFASVAPGADGHTSGAQTRAAAVTTNAGASGAREMASSNNTSSARPVGPNEVEVAQLLNVYEAKTSDTANIQSVANLHLSTHRGMPTGAAQFEADQVITDAKISDLLPEDQDYYRGAQAAFINGYESAQTKSQRDDVVQKFDSFKATLDRAGSEPRDTSSSRLLRFFDAPFGSQLLDEKGHALTTRLAQYRTDFNAATNAEQRKAVVAGAVVLKRDLQQQIGEAIGQTARKVRADEQAANEIILGALNDANAITDNGDANSNLPFARLASFGNKVFTSANNAQAFKVMQQEHPEKLADLAEWTQQVQEKTKWAQGAIQSDPFSRQPVLPEVPKGLLDVNGSEMRLDHYGDRLLNAYQNVLSDVSNAGELHHAATQHGPIRQEYLRAHTPPKPEWQQEVEEVFSRLALGAIPVVNLLTDAIVPRSHLSQDARSGIDIASAILGAGAPGAAFKAGSKFPERSEVAGGAQFDLPTRYAQKPQGALHPEPNRPDIFRDDRGQRYIRSGDQTWPVKYDKENGTWRIYDPSNPTKYQYPVRLNERGSWQLHGDVGLKGGGGDGGRSNIGALQQGNLQHELQMHRAALQNERLDLLNQRHNLEHQLHQFPGPQHANRTGLELAHLHHMLLGNLTQVNNRLHAIAQELNQLH